MEMSATLPYLQAAGTVLNAVGNLRSGQAEAQSGQGAAQAGAAAARAGAMQQQAYQFEAAQERQNASAAEAAAQRDAEEQRRQGALIQSRAVALAAASGGSVTDPGIMALLSRNAGDIAYKSSLALYAGEDKARALRMQAAAAEFSGAQAAQGGLDRQNAFLEQQQGFLERQRTYQTKAFSDLLGSQSATDLYRKFGGGGTSLKPAGWDTSFDNPADYG